MSSKEQLYRALVDDVRRDYLSRPISCNSKGIHLTWSEDCREINFWTYWQGMGNYDARIMLVGQDWGMIDEKSSVIQNIREINNGLRTDYHYDTHSKTDNHLCELFSVLGYDDLNKRYGDLFFTNLILGYRSEGCSGNLSRAWLYADAPYFSRLSDIIEPRVIICLGKDTFEGVHYALTGKMQRIKSLNSVIESVQNPVKLPLLSGKTTAVFASAHCGTIGTMNRNRVKRNGVVVSSHDLDLQKEDWKRIAAYLSSAQI